VANSSAYLSRPPVKPAANKKPSKEPALELKEACILAAHEVIAEQGVEGLSMRDVARKLGVSHQAPYKHYPSKDHLLAEVMRRCFEQFTAYLDARQHFDAPHEDLASLGQRYLSYAMSHPLEYRLMFGTPWPAPAEYPSLVKDAQHAFDVLRSVLSKLHHHHPNAVQKVDIDAMFIWSSLHGLASITQANVMKHLSLDDQVREHASHYVMEMVSKAMNNSEQ
jgi:AcrR family transcriptional regulator